MRRIFLVVLLILPGVLCAQESPSAVDKLLSFPDKLFGSIDKKSNELQHQLDEQTNKYLQRLAKSERRLKRKLTKKDPAAAKKLFGNTDSIYQSLSNQVKKPVSSAEKIYQSYNGHLDSMKTAFSFLNQAKGLGATDQLQSKIASSLNNYDQLQNKLNGADAVKKYLHDRQQQLSQQLQLFGLTRQLQTFKKEIYYYKAQVNNLKADFEDPGKLENLLLSNVSKLPAFKNFFSKNSQLGSLFRIPGGNSDMPSSSIAGLQSRGQLQQDVEQRLGSGPNYNQMQQSATDGQMPLGQLKQAGNKFRRMEKSNGGGDMPDFKPNTQRTRSFWQRLEYSSNLQSTGGSSYFPATSDIGLSLGYKLNDKAKVGVGSSYKIGWGKDIRHIDVTHQGLGFRSFLDMKLKGSFWISGGGELNYRNNPDSSAANLPKYNNWQQSALLGLKKTFKASKLTGNVQLSYDFLWRQQPAGKPILFRIGYNL